MDGWHNLRQANGELFQINDPSGIFKISAVFLLCIVVAHTIALYVDK